MSPQLSVAQINSKLQPIPLHTLQSNPPVTHHTGQVA